MWSAVKWGMSVGDWIWPPERDLPAGQQWWCHSFQLLHIFNNPCLPTEWPCHPPQPCPVLHWLDHVLPTPCHVLCSSLSVSLSLLLLMSFPLGFTLLSYLITEIIHTCCKKFLNIEKYKEESHCTYIFNIQPELILWKFFFPRVSFRACFNSWINTEFLFFLLILYCRHFLCCWCFRNVLVAAWDSVLFTYLLF